MCSKQRRQPSFVYSPMSFLSALHPQLCLRGCRDEDVTVNKTKSLAGVMKLTFQRGRQNIDRQINK